MDSNKTSLPPLQRTVVNVRQGLASSGSAQANDTGNTHDQIYNQPYGLAVELARPGSTGLPVPSQQTPPVDPVAVAARRSVAAVRRTQGFPVPQTLPPATSQASIIQQTLEVNAPEPDYGIVAELKQGRRQRQDDTSGYGLAAEVERRRAARDVSPVRSSAGGALAARPRRRLAASGAPADFSIAHQMAARAAAIERENLDPFSTANRVSNADPFIVADELIRYPAQPLAVEHAREQEVPLGPVPLLVPPTGPSVTHSVTKDDGEYGVAEELGVDPGVARRQRSYYSRSFSVPPAGPLLGYDDHGQPILAPGASLDFSEPAVPMQFSYDERTGQLIPPEGVEGDGGKEYREYIEDVATGRFYRINHEGFLRRVMLKFKRKQRKEDEVVEEGQEGWDPDAGTFRGGLRTTMRRTASTFSALGIFVQGLLGGFALLNFFMTYFLYSGNGLKEWLQYYSPIALASNRIYFTLITMSIVASAARLGHDQLRGFLPKAGGGVVVGVDVAQLILYFIAYITCILATPLDDELTYESDRNARYYMLTLSSAFKKRLSTWHGLNIVRTLCAGAGWVLASYQNSTFIRNALVQYDVQTELIRRTRKPPYPSPVEVMADTPSKDDNNNNDDDDTKSLDTHRRPKSAKQNLVQRRRTADSPPAFGAGPRLSPRLDSYGVDVPPGDHDHAWKKSPGLGSVYNKVYDVPGQLSQVRQSGFGGVAGLHDAGRMGDQDVGSRGDSAGVGPGGIGRGGRRVLFTGPADGN